ncbi:MAG: hypothetical protein L0287_12885 [Anaerolineae bacterium]|nr:hypothetical protein [Anaerolineae bacterium]MCI0613948.1 hypothetical protein [bacterium]
MKTDISIPNPVYRAAETLAKELGISLSELYTAALNAYISEHEKKSVAEEPDTVYTTEPSTIETELDEIQIMAEFNAWEAASDEALENFEKGLEQP